MKITLAGYEDIGRRHGSLTWYIGEALNKAGILRKVICRGYQDNPKVKIAPSLIKQPFFGNKIFLALVALNYFVSDRIPSRYWQEVLFDLFTQRNIKKIQIFFFVLKEG